MEKIKAVDSEISSREHQEEQKRELEKLTDKDISKEKAEEIAISQIKNFYPEVDTSKLILNTNFYSKSKIWQIQMYRYEDEKNNKTDVFFMPRIEIESETGKVIMVNNYGVPENSTVNLEEAKKTDIWKTEAEKFLKDYLGETRTPISIFSYATVVYDDSNGMQPLPGEVVKVLFKYDDNTSYKIDMSYDTHKIIGYEHERIVDFNNRFDIPNIYVDKPQDVRFLITVYK